MKIFETRLVREIDAATIAREPIASIDLMERAASRLTEAISERFGFVFGCFGTKIVQQSSNGRIEIS